MTAPTPRGEQSPEQAGEAWRNVKRDGMPPCDHEAVFVGINTNGFACCFNEVTHDGVCSIAGPEFGTVLMSGLEWWRVLDRPGSALPPAPREMSAEEIDRIWHRMGSFVPNDHRIFARAILAASAPAAPKEAQEPSPSQPQPDAARVLAEFAQTAPGRLPQHVQDAIAVVLSASPQPQPQTGGAEKTQRDAESTVTVHGVTMQARTWERIKDGVPPDYTEDEYQAYAAIQLAREQEAKRTDGVQEVPRG